jgi:hypothetical protein
MRRAWSAIQRIALAVAGTVVVLLVLFGCPLTVVLTLLIPRFRSASRPGILGIEDIISKLFLLSLICGLTMALSLAVSWLLLGNPWAQR